MTHIRVVVYDRTNGEEHLGAYNAVAAPRIGELLCYQPLYAPNGGTPWVSMLRIEEVYWNAMPAHDDRAQSHGVFVAKPLDEVTVFGRAAKGPHAS